ncbi:peptidoglycan-binding domain-containing protein [Pseudooceanicola marinus]|uniref:peptidoglycan-binding domain-containing protein n=1 Tax=Pseudooceanicola marinus TaxID=396013 RepID=UPI001CD3A572|nr:peptidoglycan-binding domain-containing protein [Pseudooceanicola marinus]MCA1336824.1 peptidoglycan-binding protein [Pseudooceanicola marinus]
MYSKLIRSTIAASLLATAPVAAMADNLGAAIVGGIIGGAIMNGASQQRKKTTTTYYAPSATRTANRETQTALNYFGFNAGTPDGVLGSRSRSAISQYQVYMGYPATGRLQPHERDALVASYNRALIGGPDVTRALNRSKDGVRGLLVLWRGGAGSSGHGGMGYAGLPIEVSDAVDEIAESTEPSPEQLLQRAGFIQTADLNGDGQNDYIVDTAVTGSTFWCGASQCTTMLFVSTSDGYQRRQFQYLMNPQRTNTVQVSYFQCDHTGCRMNDPLAGGGATQQYAAAPAPAPVAPAPQTQMAVAPAPAPAPAAPATLPTFAIPAPAPAPAPSLASYCEKVSLMTSSNGGYVTAATMTDPKVALGEQFCYSRTYAKTAGEQLMQKVPGLTPAAAAQQCAGFEPVLAPYVGSLATTPAEQVVANVAQYAANSGMTADQLAATARICLYSGYNGDTMGVALGSALLLTALGQDAYAELVGHHLNEGFGTTASPVAAANWYRMAIEAQEAGAPSAFGDSLPGRVELLRAAALGAANPAQTTTAPTVVPTALPSFTISE